MIHYVLYITHYDTLWDVIVIIIMTHDDTIWLIYLQLRHCIYATLSWEVHSPVFVIPKLQEDRLVVDCGQEILLIIAPGEYGPMFGIM